MSRYECVTTEAQLDRWVARIEGSKRFAVDSETTGKDSMLCDLVGVCLAVGDAASYVPVGHVTGEKQLPLDLVLNKLAPAMANPRVSKVLHHAVFDLTVLGRYGWEFDNVHDTQQMSYVLNVLKHAGYNDMDTVALKYMDHVTIKFDEVVVADLGMTGFQDVSLFHACEYASEDAEVTLRLFHVLKRELKDAGLWRVYNEIDRPALMAVADMKFNGVAVSQKKIKKLHEKWQLELDAINEDVQEAAPGLNVGSGKELGKFLNENGVESPKKTKTGADSWDQEALDAIEDDAHPLMPLISKFRAKSKLISTYAVPLQEMMHPETRRIHPNLKIVWTDTARLSCADPNLQNIPQLSADAKLIREAFVASPGFSLVCCDYSQIEMRILAHITKDPVLIKAFQEGLDLHSLTASKVFDYTYDEFQHWLKEDETGKALYKGKPEYDMLKDLRTKTKRINFGLIYGITQIGLAKQLKVTPDTAQGFIEKYFDELPDVKNWCDEQKRIGGEDRFVETIYGRRLFLSQEPGKRGQSYAERQAMNYQIQGPAADLMRLAMGDVRYYLNDYQLPASMLLQVHDELMLEVPTEHAQETKEVVKAAMEQAGGDWIKWRVPIVADAKIGKNWREAH